MDLLDEAYSADLHSSSSSESDDAPQVNPLDRVTTPVGHSIVLADLRGQPVGDNIRSKGSLATRIVCIQCGSTGLDRRQWGGTVVRTSSEQTSETALVSASQHALACRGLLQAGYRAISHGRPE